MPPDRRRRKKDLTRKALLEAALGIFAERGIYAPTVEDLTEAADVAKGTFYNYFDSRDDLLAVLLHQVFDMLIGDIEREAKRLKTRESVLRLLLQAHTKFFRSRPDYFLILHQARGWMMLNDEKGGSIRSEYLRYVDYLAGIVAGTLWGARQRPATLTRTARAIAGYCAGIMSYDHILGGRKSKAPDLAAELQRLSSLL